LKHGGSRKGRSANIDRDFEGSDPIKVGPQVLPWREVDGLVAVGCWVAVPLVARSADGVVGFAIEIGGIGGGGVVDGWMFHRGNTLFCVILVDFSVPSQSLDPGSGEGPMMKSVKYGRRWGPRWAAFFGPRSLNAG
jgi:hypothetical protein